MKTLIVLFGSVLMLAAGVMYVIGGFAAVMRFTAQIGGNFGFIGALVAFCLCVGIWITGGVFMGTIVMTLFKEWIEK